MRSNNYMSCITASAMDKEGNIINIAQDDFMKYTSKADMLRNSGKYKESVSCYLQSIMFNRNDYHSYIGLAQSYKFLNDYDKAIKILKKSIELKPENYLAYYELGICYLLKSKPEEAIQCFQKSISLDKNQLDVQLQLALAHEIVEEQDMALIIYNKIIEEHPEYIKAHSHKAALYICQGKYLEASKIFFDILSKNSAFHRAYFGLAVCFDNMKKISEAKRFYSKFLRIKPNSSHADYAKERLGILSKNNTEKVTYMSLVCSK